MSRRITIGIKKKSSRSQGGGLDKVRRIDEAGALRAVIETPLRSRNKYSHDAKENVFLLKKVRVNVPRFLITLKNS